MRKMSDEIHEIIRVLQLTTYDEEEWDADDLTVMKKAQVINTQLSFLLKLHINVINYYTLYSLTVSMCRENAFLMLK